MMADGDLALQKGAPEPAPSPEALKIRARKDRKIAKRSLRLARAIAGQHTRSPNATTARVA